MGSSKTSTDPRARRVCALALSALLTATAQAQPARTAGAPTRTRVSVGGRSVDVAVEDRTLVVGDARVPFPLGRAPTRPPVVESITVRGVRLALVRYREGDAVVELLLGPTGVLHVGRADLHGDPGERSRAAITFARGTVLREEEDERHRLCDGTRMKRVRALDVTTGRFVQVPREGDPIGDVVALTTNEGPERPIAPLVRWAGADFEASADAPQGARELTYALDARPATALVMTAPTSRARPTIVGRWEGGATYPVAAIGFVPRPAGAVGSPPAYVRVQLDDRALVLRTPADVAEGARLFHRLPDAVAARCVSIEIGPPMSGDRTAMGDVALFASFDLEGGLERVVTDLAVGGEAGTLAADVLARAGEPAARLLATRIAEMPAGERRLALRVAARLAERSDTARGLVANALGDADETVRRMALEATRGLGEQGALLLEAHVRAGGLDVVSELVRRDPARALAALLARLEAAEDAERPRIRAALVEAGRRVPEDVLVSATSGTSALPASARAELGLVAASLAPTHDVARTIAESLVGEEAFPLRYKALQITRTLPGPSRGEVLLTFARRSLEAGEWMTRAEAIRIVGDPGVAGAAAARARLLEDAYPRVRIAAIEAGPLDDTLVVAVARLARLDDWSIVRAAAVSAIASDARTRPIQRAAVRDRAERVRIAAIEVLVANRDVGAYEQIEGRLRAPGERPDVYRAALRYVRALCVREAVPAVADLLDRMAEDERTIDVAQEAALVLTALGTDDARDALSRVPGNVRGPLDAPNAARPALCVPVEAP